MNEQVTQIIKKHNELLNCVNENQPISKIVKDIDHIVQDMYLELYSLIDGRKCLTTQEPTKKGHCC